MKKNLTNSELLMVKTAIDTHIKALYRDVDAYKRNGNIEAVRDCLDEVNNYRVLKENFDE